MKDQRQRGWVERISPTYSDTSSLTNLNEFSQPTDVVLSDCFIVPEITGGALLDFLYNYHHICPQKLREDGLQSFQFDKHWILVGSLKSFVEGDPEPFDYKAIKQSLIKFVYLNETIVKFLLRSTDEKFQIKFQSLEQSQAFYAMIYHDVALSPAVSISAI